MKIDFDPEKNQKNIAERSISFEIAYLFDFSTAVVDTDIRHDYGETRKIATGFIAGRLFVMVFKPIDGGIRVISLRKANPREKRKYESQKN